ncbi:MAG TPA: glycosyltransferase [Bryobacteraceae bacterium]|nr:glycosyltransferase [Bryobacteraceae bacterium]
MMPAWHLALWALSLAIAVPTAVWAFECAAALLLSPGKPRSQDGPRPRVTILIPAHNEALGIRQTLASVLPQLVAEDRLVVIADNCADDTAAIARAHGATVFERIDPARPGKSYALEFGMSQIRDWATDVVIAIDADCTALPEAISHLARMAFRTGRPAQASYYLEPPEVSSPQFHIAALAFYIKNVVRPGGLAKLGLPCFLNGSGMAIPVRVAHSLNWANQKIAEDKWSTADLALAGDMPSFCPESRISSRLPHGTRALATQRVRWIHGHLETMLGQGPRLIAAAVRQMRPGLLVLALDLLVPPFSYLNLLWLVGLAIALVALLLSGVWGPAVFLAVWGGIMVAMVAAIDRRFGGLPWWQLVAAMPGYFSSRMRLLGSFALRRQKQWIPTARDRRQPEQD